MFDLVYYLINLLFFNIPLLYYYINFRLSVIFCLSSEDIYLSFDISLSNLVFSVSLSTVSELFCGESFDTFLILSTILLPIKSKLLLQCFEMLLLKKF